MSREESPVVRPADEGYTWMHRAFLHAFITQGVLTIDALKPILAHAMTCHNPARPTTAGDIMPTHINNTIHTINAKIEPYDFEIRSTLDQETKMTIYAYVNKTSDPLTQLATKFTANEIAYIRRLLDFMFETNNTHLREVMAIKHTDASNLAHLRRNRQSQANSSAEDGGTPQPAETGISIAEGDEVLDSLVREAFFKQSRAGYYSLAPRGLMELGAYLKETYNEAADDSEDGEEIIRIRDCEGCKELVTHGIRCDNRDCGVRWHDRCATSYWRGRTSEQRKCPTCKTECGGKAFVGERADRPAGRSSIGGRARQEREESESE